MNQAGLKLKIGANVTKNKSTEFRVWAPRAKTVSVQIASGTSASGFALEPESDGFFSGTAGGVSGGDRYFYRLDEDSPRPDPASRFQPDGVHGASCVVDPAEFIWQDDEWNGIPLEEYLIYELHVGTFSRNGTFTGIIEHLDYLKELGITAIELMPVAQCPGRRNWGYDGVYPFAPQNSYGGPEGLKQLVNTCHAKGIAVILDVVYNHFGPEGNYSGSFGYYVTEKYKTPWGDALNFDGPFSDPVNDFFISNALYWFEEYHVDALRLDAVDWIFDLTAKHFLQRLAEEVTRYRETRGKKLFLIAEYDANDARLTRPREMGGYGLDAQWNDGFHHSIRTLLTKETTGYYQDFGSFNHLVKSFREGFAYTGQYSCYRKRRHGASSADRPGYQFVVFCQNHDQVGNRKCGDRLSTAVSIDKLLLAAGTVILSPYIPLLFMGEEYGEKAPFHYFIDHSDQELIAAVRKGKAEEHASGACIGDPPDPQAESTFLESKIDVSSVKEADQAVIMEMYRTLIALRKESPSFKLYERNNIQITGYEQERVLSVVRTDAEGMSTCIYCYSDKDQNVSLTLPPGVWQKALDSSERKWCGSGAVAPERLDVHDSPVPINISPFTFIVYLRNWETR